MIFKHTFQLGLDDLNANRELKNRSLLRILEDVAGYHSDLVKQGVNQLNELGTAWALLDWQIKVFRRPKYGELIEARTWGRFAGRCHVYRDFEVYVGDELCAIATSKWMFMDLNKRRPMIIKPEVINQYEMEEGRSVFQIEELPKLPAYENYEFVAEYPIRKSDIDVNGHVHNLNYWDIAAEALDISDARSAEPDANEFRITYRKEIRYGEPVKIFRHLEPDRICLKVTSLDEKEVHTVMEVKG